MDMDKKFFLAALAVFVLSMVFGFVVHGALLGGTYATLPELFRTPEDSQNYFHFMLLAHILFSFGFVWIYRQGKANKPWLGQGLRYGIAVALIAIIPVYLIYYAVQPTPGMLVFKQIIFDTIAVTCMGIVAAWLER